MSQTLLPADICVEAIIVAGGNTYLAAERLFGTDSDAVANLMASISRDPLAQASLNAQLRTLTTLRAFDALTQAQLMLPTIMTELEPNEFAKLYTQLLAAVSSLATASVPVDPTDAMTRLVNALPPDARRAFLTLVRPAQPSIEAPVHDDIPSEVVNGDEAA